MAKVASGGETSRLMLALKTVLGRADETPTLIFDEIDQGIGGRVGGTVGRKLWGLTRGQGSGVGAGAGAGDREGAERFQLPVSSSSFQPSGPLHHSPAAVGSVWRCALSRGEAHCWGTYGDRGAPRWLARSG